MNINTDDPDDEPTQEEVEAYQLTEIVNELGEEFDALCQERHNIGADKYGPLTWMENDVVRMMIEELADTANYCRYQSVKLMLLQKQLEIQLAGEFTPDADDNISIGVKAFRGTKEGWKK